MSTNVPQIQWQETGLVVPTAAQILAGTQQDLNAAFNGNLNFTNQQTPEAQLAASLAAIISNCYAAIAYFVANVNPAAASDFMQDAIGYIYFLNRIQGEPTTVQCTCSGLAGTLIPAGTQAQDTSGNVYESTTPAVIGSGGVTVTFQNIVDGPIACPANTLTVVVQTIPGWDSLTNPADGVIGSDVESQAAFLYRMQQSVAINSQGALQALFSALAAQVGAPNVLCLENDTGGTVNTGATSYPLVANSIYVAVVGGVPASIAETIWAKKSPGCNMNGNQSVTVYDPSYPAGQQPAYTIKYNVPTNTGISFAVRIANSATLPANITTLVQNAIIAQFQNGAGSNPPQGIGSLIVAADYFAGIIATFPSMALLSVLIGTPFVGLGTLTSGSPNLVITSATSGYLAPGDIVTGTDIPAGTYIDHQASGTPGGAGTYVMTANATATVSTPEAITSAAGNNQKLQCGIDQMPVVSAANISVTLI